MSRPSARIVLSGMTPRTETSSPSIAAAHVVRPEDRPLAPRDWAALGREPSELYRGPRLATTREWLARDGHDAELNPLETEFVRSSIAREDAEPRQPVIMGCRSYVAVATNRGREGGVRTARGRGRLDR